MHFENDFVVTGAPESVATYFADVPLMAGFLPGASVGAPDAQGHYPATLVASFGPKKLAFNGTLRNTVDAETLSGVLTGQASADVRGARMAVTMKYQLSPAGSAATRVHLASDAQLTGVLAEFAKAGGTLVAEALIAEFARRFSAHVEAAAAGQPAPAQAQGPTLSTATVLAAVLKRLLRPLRSMFAKPTRINRSPR